jgi:hypothetical protein
MKNLLVIIKPEGGEKIIVIRCWTEVEVVHIFAKNAPTDLTVFHYERGRQLHTVALQGVSSMFAHLH